MKKLLTLIMAGIMTLSLTACSKDKETASSANSDVGSNIPISTSFYGKVSTVAGNEIELNLVKEPQASPTPETSGEDKINFADGGMAVTMLPSTGADVAPGGAEQRIEQEFTGEMKAFVIPAGMAVKDAMGNEKQFSDIKKGSMMNVFVDDEGNITEVFLYE